MKANSIFVDLRNPEHREWWNKIASKFVKVVNYTYIVETATGKKIGVVLRLKGPFSRFVINENVKRFIKHPAKDLVEIRN